MPFSAAMGIYSDRVPAAPPVEEVTFREEDDNGQVPSVDTPSPCATRALMTIARDERVASDAVLAKFLKEIRTAGARFVLFGSRVRDDWRPDSDYDILVVLPRKDREVKSRLCDTVVDVLCEAGCLVSLKAIDQATYDLLGAIPTPIMANVTREGIAIG
jgi:predicted nucleotidyltransferase